MKKQLLTGLFAVSFVLAASAAQANGTPPPAPAPEGVEISGAVDIVTGYQRDSATNVGGGIGGLVDYGRATAASGSAFRFLVNQVELDLAKSFGENIRLRADIDFIDLANTGLGANAMNVEQAYVTANIAAGNGIEFLIGKFNAPVGVESVDTRDNWLISYSPNFRYLTPADVTGAKIYYAFSDLVDLHFALVNDLNSAGFGSSVYPGGLFRLGFNWGGDQKNTVGLSGGFSSEAGATANGDFDYFGDLDLMIALSDAVKLSGEGTYRVTSNTVAGAANQTGMAANLALNYRPSDAWDVSFRAGWENDSAPAGRGASTTGVAFNGAAAASGKTNVFHGAVGTGYQIADGAKMKWEYRFDMLTTAAAAVGTQNAHSLLAQFAYTF